MLLSSNNSELVHDSSHFALAVDAIECQSRFLSPVAAEYSIDTNQKLESYARQCDLVDVLWGIRPYKSIYCILHAKIFKHLKTDTNIQERLETVYNTLSQLLVLYEDGNQTLVLKQDKQDYDKLTQGCQFESWGPKFL